MCGDVGVWRCTKCALPYCESICTQVPTCDQCACLVHVGVEYKTCPGLEFCLQFHSERIVTRLATLAEHVKVTKYP